jgi:hypothetical protein
MYMYKVICVHALENGNRHRGGSIKLPLGLGWGDGKGHLSSCSAFLVEEPRKKKREYVCLCVDFFLGEEEHFPLSRSLPCGACSYIFAMPGNVTVDSPFFLPAS